MAQSAELWLGLGVYYKPRLRKMPDDHDRRPQCPRITATDPVDW